MKNIILSIIIAFNLFLVIPAIAYAQDTSDTATTTTTEEQTTTLSDSLTTEQTTTSNISFGVILIAVITPLLLFALAYLIIKMTKS